MALSGAQGIAQQTISVVCRRQSTTERINRSQFYVAVELFAKCHARAPTARRAAVISKASRKIILKIIGGRQIVAPAEDRHVAGLRVGTPGFQPPPGCATFFRKK